MNKKLTYYILFVSTVLPLSMNGMETDTIVRKKAVKKENLKDRIFNSPMVLKTSPTAFLLGAMFPPVTAEYRLMAEISSGKRQSEQLGISYLGKNIFWNFLEKQFKVPVEYHYKVEGWRIQYAHKFYLVGRRGYAPFGFFFGPSISYTNARVAIGRKRYYEEVYFDFRHFNANAILGVQLGKANSITFEVYGGIGYKSNKVYYHASSANITPYDAEDFGPFYQTNLNVLFGINIGYAR